MNQTMIRTRYNKFWYFLLVPVVGIGLALLFLPQRTGHEENSVFYYYIVDAVIMTSGIWFGCMVIVMFLWKKFPWEQKPTLHLILEIILIFIYTNVFSYGIYKLEIYTGFGDFTEDIFLSAVITNLITLLITAIHEAVEFYQQWKYNFSKSVRLEKDNIEAKYEMLKTQINPHFLFNSLNSLTTIVEENEDAVQYIQNLSEFLRYMLKSRDRQLVLLREEVNVLRQYVELQQSRFKENLDIVIDVDEKFFHFSIPPLVVQMLVENCIKHNVISKGKPLKITVKAEREWLYVENNLQKKNEISSTGQGLRNISERYRFFTTQQVKIHETNSTFRVSIPLLEVDL